MKKEQIDSFFKDVEAIADRLEEEGSRAWFLWFNFNKTHKAKLIREALARVSKEFYSKQNPELEETLYYHTIHQLLNYKERDNISLIEALNYNRLFIHRKETATLLNFEQDMRRKGYQEGFRSFIEKIAKKLALFFPQTQSRPEDFHTAGIYKFEVQKISDAQTVLVLSDQGRDKNSASFEESRLNPKIVNAVNNTQIDGLRAEELEHKTPRSSSHTLNFFIENNKYQNIVDQLDLLPQLEEVERAKKDKFH